MTQELHPDKENSSFRSKAAQAGRREPFREMMELLPISAFECDMAGRVIFANAAGLRQFGYRPEALETGLFLHSVVAPEDLPRALHTFTRIAAGQAQTGNIYTFNRRDGSRFVAMVYSSPLLREGIPFGIRGMILDISEYRRAEETIFQEREQLLSVFDGIDESVYISDPETFEILYANRALIKSLGNIVGRRCHEALHGLLEQCPFCTNERIFGKNIGKSYSCEVHNQLNGRWYRSTGRAIRWPDGRWVRLEFAIDIEEQKQREAERLKNQKLESLSVLAGGIAHDFNNLLTAILGNIDLATQRLEEAGTEIPYLQSAEKAAARAQDLTRQLLTFSKGGAPVKKTGSLAELVRDVAEFALRGSKSRAILEIPPDLRTVEMDIGQISQVIQNLVINADQSMPQGGVITISLWNDLKENDLSSECEGDSWVGIAIHDEGVGIPAEHLDRIFDPYFTTKETGSGLGLASAYSIIKQHGGTITVSSREGGGSTFIILLPAGHGTFQEPPLKKAATRSGKGRQILIVDDEDLLRELCAVMLDNLGYRAVIVASGEEALDAYRKSCEEQRPFDAVILDLTIPGGMGGLETLRELKLIDPRIRAVVASGYSNGPILANFEEYGFAAALAKPFKIEDLACILDAVLRA